MFASATIHIALLIYTVFFGHNVLHPSAAHHFPAIYVRAYYCFTASLFIVVVCCTAVVLVRVRETCQNTSSSSSLAGNVGPRCCIVTRFLLRPYSHPQKWDHAHAHTHAQAHAQTHTDLCSQKYEPLGLLVK